MKKNTLIVFCILLVSLNVGLQAGKFAAGWEKLVTRCPVFYAIEAKNIARFGLLGIDGSTIFATGAYGLKRRFDVPMCNHPLLTSAICAFFFRVFGVHVWVTQLLALLFGIGISLMAMLLAWRMSGMWLCALLAGTLASLVPAALYYNHILDRWWLDIFWFLAVIILYRRVSEDGFLNFKEKAWLYFFTLLACLNGWRLLALPPLLMLHSAAKIKEVSADRKNAGVSFLREYGFLLALITVALLWFMQRMHAMNLVDYLRLAYLKTEPKPADITIWQWAWKYFRIQTDSYTPVLCVFILPGLAAFFFNRRVTPSDKALMAIIILWGVLTSAFLTKHAYYIYSLHNAFFIPVVLLSAYLLARLIYLIPKRYLVFRFVFSVFFFAFFILSAQHVFARWPFKRFPLRSFESEINRATLPEDIIATNSDLTGQHDYSTDIRNPVNLHNMFYMDREIKIFKSKGDFLKNGGRYKYFVFEKSESGVSGEEEGLFEYLKSHSADMKEEGRFYIFRLKE